MLAVLASGMSSMSEASMPFQPAIEEPSKAWPLLNLSSSKWETGTVTCCSLPRVSVKRKSTNLTSFSFTIFITSATVLAAIRFSPLDGWLRDSGGGFRDAGSVPKLVHGASCAAGGFCAMLGSVPYGGLAVGPDGDEPAWCILMMHHLCASAFAHQFGAELGAQAMQPRQQVGIGGGGGVGRSLDPEVDVPTVLRVVDAGQAEHLDAGMRLLHLLHQRGERG